MASSVAFFALLALFPALIALVAIYGLVATPETVQGETLDIVVRDGTVYVDEAPLPYPAMTRLAAFDPARADWWATCVLSALAFLCLPMGWPQPSRTSRRKQRLPASAAAMGTT